MGDDDVERVVVRTLETIPAGATHWSKRSMAKACGLSAATVGRIWRAFENLKPHRCETAYSGEKSHHSGDKLPLLDLPSGTAEQLQLASAGH